MHVGRTTCSGLFLRVTLALALLAPCSGVSAQGLLGDVVNQATGAVGGVTGSAGEAVGGVTGLLGELTGEGGILGPGGIVGPSPVILDQAAAVNAVRSSQALPLTDMLSIARLYVDGEIIDVHLISVRGFLLYEIKALSGDGAIFNSYFYASSGNYIPAD